ncbi:MFS transporter, PAT family, beta-lactamase induction signal transducer AmpG [Thermodesulfovibrio aggregans]|uniref:MFS transporter, PAT family, beta-lactamase induction signal transducer AmpG n=1 Tax=Thermodesulfovibrio aggregans TaxID=86166 RepID=A0A0U9HPB1_9BACT|nr:MFS transporter [Thermodesulfovibrio aggregans]GAQ94876.1 MFS transporter, PAT family, beta-lactamase induction signal transducer AmpG [Thermodesulfovibrio aggregans]
MSKRTKDIAVVTALGFASGLPFPLISGTLQAWLTTEGIDIETIGILTILTFPYSFKFLWSALFDRFSIPGFGRRRGWIIICQILILAGIFLMITFTPKHLLIFSMAAAAVAFFSASQDISIDAYRTEILRPKDRGIGASFAVTAYRVALIVGGGLCLLLADYLGWQIALTIISSFLIIGIITTIWADEPDDIKKPATLKESFIEPFRDLLKREKSFILLLFIVLYKIGDAYASSLSTAFFIRAVGFSLSEVGTVNKIGGLLSAIVGSLIGGFLLRKISVYKALISFGILQAASNLMFMLLSIEGKNLVLFVLTVIIENFTGGMGTTAFLAFLMGLCNRSFAATQYALLSSLASFGRVMISPTAGFVVENIGWTAFYFLTFLVAIPGVILIIGLKNQIIYHADR